MNRSSTSNSSSRTRFPVPTKPALLAVLILMAVRIALYTFDTDALTYLDSRRTFNVFRNDVACQRMAKDPPEVILLGTSRTRQIDLPYLTRLLGLDPRGAINLSRAGADFVFMETVLRRNPEILRNAKVVLMDVMPMQSTGNFTYDERGESFLRFATLEQRLHASDLLSRIIGVSDLVLPVRSEAQDPYEWRTGFTRLGMPLSQRAAYLDRIPLEQITAWKARLESMPHEDQVSERIEFCADVLFASPDHVRNQVEALSKIIELMPDQCTLILVWLPFRDDVRAIAASSPRMTAARDQFRELLQSAQTSSVKIQWFDRPEGMGITNTDYSGDGIHFSTEGIWRFTRTYAALAFPHL